MRHISFQLKTKRLIETAALALGFYFSAAFLMASAMQAFADDPATSLPATSHPVTAIVRDGKNLVSKQIVLPDLTSTTAFQGKYFTVVDGQSDQPIAFNAAPDLVLKAATVYEIFSQSRQYFKDKLAILLPTLPSAQQGYLDQPMVIRLNMTHPFSAEIHYDLKDAIDNGAVTVPASDQFRSDDVPAWGVETWFFVAKKDKIGNAASQLPALLSNSQFKLSVFESLADQDMIETEQTIQTSTFAPTVLAEDLIVSFGLAEILPPVISTAIKIIPGHIYLDAAMIPEIGANEYAHYALYPWLGLQRRFHVGEGYAHYFAGKITGLTRLQDHAKPYSKGYTSIRGDSSDMYSYMKEVGASAAMSSFTFSVLEDLEKVLKDDGIPVIVGTLPYLNSSSSLNLDFTRSVFDSVSDLGARTKKDVSTDDLWVHSVLEKRGF